ncbi:hypothetical protein DPMN_103557 [Dreissena polymorpha]|uniref:Uncharacterized protein n=1 Tax=Dreissena polymorpha TaxID=45954 RepID=A0A9D4K0A5_DREPO|nr:hypothetical protein DPMN_103557 [Dreissena polymorpha]
MKLPLSSKYHPVEILVCIAAQRLSCPSSTLPSPLTPSLLKQLSTPDKYHFALPSFKVFGVSEVSGRGRPDNSTRLINRAAHRSSPIRPSSDDEVKQLSTYSNHTFEPRQANMCLMVRKLA